MSIFIKAGFWINKKLGFNEELNLTKYVTDLIAATPAELRPYKVYTAILNQAETDAPTAIVLENTLGLIGDLSWTRVGIGEYSLSSVSGVFTNNKTYLSIQNGYPEIKNDISPAGIHEVRVYSYSITGGEVVPADNNIFDVSIEIRVYN